jgi:LysM repeat protein
MFVRIFILVAISVLVWSVVARSSNAHGPRTVVTVKPHDTLWSIAARNYAGDPRDAIWRIEQANHLAVSDVRVGQRIVLP